MQNYTWNYNNTEKDMFLSYEINNKKQRKKNTFFYTTKQHL